MFSQSTFGAAPSSTTPAFGAAQPSSPFGATQANTSSAFGVAPTPAFGAVAAPGAPSFGSPAAPAFGSSSAGSTFGAPVSVAAAPAFGSTSVGGGGMFGQPQGTASAFGAPATQPAASGGLFGTSAPTASPFGGASGAPSTGAFGTSTSTFGAPATAATSSFGTLPAQQTAFGVVSAPFGSPAPTSGFGGFGASTSIVSHSGTSAVPYRPSNRPDGANSIICHHICAMTEHEKKSPEELRWEDYQAGQRGSKHGGATVASSSTTTAFGSPASIPGAGSLFGGPAPAPASTTNFGGFGASTATPTTGGLFGGPAPAPSTTTAFSGFGASAPAPATGGLFGGAPAPTTGGLFGAAVPAPAPPPAFGFGNTATTSAPVGLFGTAPSATAPTSTFGFGASPSPAPTGGLFGAARPVAAAGGGLFGTAPAPTASGSGFGFGATTAPAPTPGLFGSAAAPATGLFGAATGTAAPATTFGFSSTPTPAPAGTSLFGTVAPTAASAKGLFGTAAATTTATPSFSFGGASTGGFSNSANTPTTNLFGGTAPVSIATGGVFSGTSTAASSGGLFGSALSGSSTTASAPMNFGSSIFSPPAATYASAPAITAPVLTTDGRYPSVDPMLANKIAAVEACQLELCDQSSLKLLPSVLGADASERIALQALARGNTSTTSNFSFQNYYMSQRPRQRITRPRHASLSSNVMSDGNGFDGGGGSILSPEFFLKRGAGRKLIIRSDALEPKTPPTRLLLTEAENAGISDTSNPVTAPSAAPAPTVAETETVVRPSEATTPGGTSANTTVLPSRTPPSTDNRSYYDLVVAQDKHDKEPLSDYSGGLTPTLCNEEYIITPSLSELATMTAAELATVSNFSISRPNYGSISWSGAVDVRSLDVDASIRIEDQSVSVYTDEEECGTKPCVGEKLNRGAVVTIYRVFPRGDINATSVAKFEKKVARKTKKIGAEELLEYNAETGVWRFRVVHFSRYTFEDTDSESEEEVDAVEADANNVEDLALLPNDDCLMAQEHHDAASITTRSNHNQDEDIVRKSETAYQILDDAPSIWMTEDVGLENTHSVPIELEDFVDAPREGYQGSIVTEYVKHIPPLLPLASAPRMNSPSSGICSKIAEECSVKTSSKDYGLVMGRCFRMSWTPDGRLLSPAHISTMSDRYMYTRTHSSKHLVRFLHPILTNGDFDGQNNCLEPLLRAHLKSSVHVSKSDDCPLYGIPQWKMNKEKDNIEYGQYCNALDNLCFASEKLIDKSGAFVNKIDQELLKLPYRAFSLLWIFYGQIDDSDPISIFANVTASFQDSMDRRHSSLLEWFNEAVSMNTNLEVVAQNEPFHQIFAALIANDLSKACHLAIDSGNLHLATLLASGTTGGDVYEQMCTWNQDGALNLMDLTLGRIYTLLAGDLQTERELHQAGVNKIDWRHCFLLRLSCSEFARQGLRKGLKSALEEYLKDVLQGMAPSPLPHYAFSPVGTDCILFNLLNMCSSKLDQNTGCHDTGLILSKFLSPSSYTSNAHDHSLAFHLVTVMQTMGLHGIISLDSDGLVRLCQSYALQLISAGLWHWAVYVLLHVGIAEDEKRTMRVFEAKKAVMRYCKEDLNSDVSKFLVDDVGVPAVWLEEAYFVRCRYNQVHGLND